MKKFLYKFILFITPALIYTIIAIFVMPFLLSIKHGPSTEQQITYSFKNALNKDYELLILGNSRTYRGLNPDYFSISAYNFSHDNDSYNQIYYKLLYLFDNKKKFNYLILGVDYFQFSINSDTRNYIYGDLFNDNYLKDYNTGLFKSKVEHYLSSANPKKLFSLFSHSKKPFIKENGQYIMPGKATEEDSVQRDITRLKFQENYFEKIIKLCKLKNVKVFIVMPPIRNNELKSYTKEETKKFNNYIEKFTDNKSVYYFNYSKISGFETKDYTDITHLNEDAANRFSQIVNHGVLGLIKNPE